MYRHLFPSCFSKNETSEKLVTVFGSDQKKKIIEKNIFSLIFLFRYQFFLCCKTFDLKTWRHELNLQKQTKNAHKI